MPRENATNRPTRLGIEVLESRTMPAWFGTSGGLSIAVGNVFPGTGSNDLIEGTGPGTPAVVGISTPKTHQVLATLHPFGNYSGGVFVAAGDVTGDGQDDLIVSTAGGMTGTVEVFEFINGGMQLIASFTPFGPFYSGGVDVAVGNVTGDATSEIVVGQSSGGSLVKVFAYDNSSGTPQYDEIRSFQAFPTGYAGGVTLAVSSIDAKANTKADPYNHNYAEIITGRARQFPVVKIWDAQTPTVKLRSVYNAFDTSIVANRQGVNVAAGDTDGQRGAEIYVALRNSATIRIFNGETGAVRGTIHSYPSNYAKMVNMAIGGVTTFVPPSDPIAGTFTPHDLVMVAADHYFQQSVLDYPGKAGNPAGLNGSQIA